MTEYKVVITETRSYRVNADSADSAKWQAVEVHGSNEQSGEVEYVNIEEVLESGAYDRWQWPPPERWQCDACPWVEGCEVPFCDEGLW